MDPVPHRLDCLDCSAVYISETGRQFCIRLLEYIEEASSVDPEDNIDGILERT